MLSRTAASLYWLGRYLERADFIARLVEATTRLDSVSAAGAGEAAWASALAVTDTAAAFAATGQAAGQARVVDFLACDRGHPGSLVRCLDAARDNAKAVRTALTREAWTAVNRAWMATEPLRGAGEPLRGVGAADAVMPVLNTVKDELRGFDGAVGRMLRNQPTWFVRLGQAVERADTTARLLDVKYHILLPAGEAVGGPVDRDGWTTILQTVSAVTAYRWLYSDGLSAANVIDLLIARPELPRSLAASVAEVVELLDLLAWRTGRHGEADAAARARAERHARLRSGDVIAAGLHQYLEGFIDENDRLHAAIGAQFRFP